MNEYICHLQIETFLGECVDLLVFLAWNHPGHWTYYEKVLSCSFLKTRRKGGISGSMHGPWNVGKRVLFFISAPWYRAKGYVFLVVLNYVVGLQLRTMTFTATDILCKRCFTFSGYNVLMWSQLEEGKIIWKKKCITTILNVLDLF